MYRSYKCYNPNFLVCLNVFSFILLKQLNFSCNKKIFCDKTSTYIGKLEKISQTVRIIGPVCIIGT